MLRYRFVLYVAVSCVLYWFCLVFLLFSCGFLMSFKYVTNVYIFVCLLAGTLYSLQKRGEGRVGVGLSALLPEVSSVSDLN